MANTPEQPNVPELNVNFAALPALIDLNGINKHLCPMSRSMVYELATNGEIETASLGLKRGRRVFVTASVVKWLQRRITQTKRPNVAPRTNRGQGQPVKGLQRRAE